MLNSFKIAIILITLTLIQGCGTDSSSNYPTTLGDAASVTVNDTANVMTPSPATLKHITLEIGNIIQKNISIQNEIEATHFIKQTNYCDISGQKEFENLDSLQNITNITEYKNCKETQSTENGKVKINYGQMDNEGKFPKLLLLTIDNNYTYNSIELKKGLIIQSTIHYDKNKNIDSISLKINGTIHYKLNNYLLLEKEQILNY